MSSSQAKSCINPAESLARGIAISETGIAPGLEDLGSVQRKGTEIEHRRTALDDPPIGRSEGAVRVETFVYDLLGRLVLGANEWLHGTARTLDVVDEMRRCRLEDRARRHHSCPLISLV